MPFKRVEEAAKTGSPAKTQESIARIIASLRGSFKLVELLETLKFPKATYMYWQKRFDRPNPDQEIEEKMLEIRKDHKDYGCLRLKKELENQGIHVNKKKIQRLIKKLGIEVKSYTRKSRRYNSYRGKVGTVAKNRIHRRFYTNICHQKITTDTTEFKYYEVETTGVVRQKKLYLDPSWISTIVKFYLIGFLKNQTH
ncbi:transposase [Enterococcus saccharolyticus]|nr:transposase [Enterococcus saccharolyticus]